MRRHYSGNSSGRGLVAAMEAEGDEVVEDKKGDEAESVSAEVDEVNQDAAEGEAAEADVEEAADTAEALESIVVAMEACVANGGLNRDAANVVNLAVGHMYARVGIRTKAMPALESFGSNSSRIGSTQIALEGIKEEIQRIWKAIVDAIKKSIAWVTDHFMKIFGAAQKMEKRADALAKRADATNGQEMKEKTFDNDRIVKALHIGGAVLATAAGAEQIKKLATVLFTEAAQNAGEAGEAMAKSLEDFDKGSAGTSLSGIVSKGGKPSYCPDDAPVAEGFEEPGESMKTARSAQLPGGQAIIANYSTVAAGDTAASSVMGADGKPASAGSSGDSSSDAAVSAFTRSFIKVGAFSPKATAPTKETVNTLGTTEARKIAEIIKTLATEIIGYKAKLDKFKKIKERIAKAAERIGKDASNATEAADNKEGLQAAQKIASAAPKKLDQPFASFSAYALNTGNAYLNYVELSLKHFKPK